LSCPDALWLEFRAVTVRLRSICDKFKSCCGAGGCSVVRVH